MFTLNVTHALYSKTGFTGSIIKVLDFFKSPQRSQLPKNKPDKSSTAYLLHLVEKGQTIFNIGAHQASALYFLSQKVGDSGKVIAFEWHGGLYNYLSEVKQLLNWSNVTIENLPLSGKAGQQTITLSKKDKPLRAGAMVVNFDVHRKKALAKTEEGATLDKYCAVSHVLPDVVKIEAGGEELKVLQGATETLKSHKPKIFVSCDERKAGREKIQALFSLLTGMHYKGYFMLDCMLLPLDNFDFDVYQNQYADFYCSDFIFM